MEIVTHYSAKSQGLTRYFTGEPCRKGHVAQRMVSNRYCCECKRLRENSNQSRVSYRKRRYDDNRERLLADAKERYAITGPNVEYTKEWREANAESIRKYRKDNAGLYAYHAAKRRKLVKLATPAWVDMEEIRAIYLEAARISLETGIPHEVDHIIPIKHKLVCGLHVPENLRIIPATENRSKNNKFKPQHSAL